MTRALFVGPSVAHAQPGRGPSVAETQLGRADPVPRTSTHFHEVAPPIIEVVGSRLIVARRDHVGPDEARARAAYYRDWTARHASALQVSPLSGRWSR